MNGGIALSITQASERTLGEIVGRKAFLGLDHQQVCSSEIKKVALIQPHLKHVL